MKSKRDTLTNETIKRRYRSQFDLVNDAIHMAEEVILLGKTLRSKGDTQNNLALLILEEIATSPEPVKE